MVLFRKDSRRGQLVAAASPLAQRDGVQIDMPMSEAKSLLWRGATNASRRSTSLENPTTSERPFHILPHDPAANLYAIEKLADDLDSFSPIIGLQNDNPQPDCIFLDVTGLAPLFGSEIDLAQSVLDFCSEQGYLAKVAIAQTLGQSQGFAQYGMPNDQGKTGDANTTHSAIYISHSKTSFHSLPVTTLRLSAWITKTLHQLGIRTIDQLLRLPRKDLSARFGNEIHTRIDQMIGTTGEPIIARQPQPEFYAQQLLDHPTSHKETIEVILNRLIENICRQMKALQQGALQWTIRLYCQDSKLPLKLYVSLFQPTATAEHVVQLAQMQLEQILNPFKKPKSKSKSKSTFVKLDGQPIAIQEITVTVTSGILIEHRQRKLFDENPRLDKQALAQLINRLSGRLGRENVVYPAMVSGAQPEHAYQLKPLVNPYSRGPRRTANSQKIYQHSHKLARPFKMFRPAIELQTASTSQPAQPTPPASITLAQTHHPIINHWGPERIETGWWRGRTTRRDYWRVETQSHQQFWIYHDLRRCVWFLQGEF